MRGLMMVPLAFIVKGPMRHLDAFDSDGRSLPLMGSRETSTLIIQAVLHVLHRSGVKDSRALRTAVEELVANEGTTNLEKTRNLIVSGKWGETEIWDRGLPLEDSVQRFLQNLSTDFVLIALIPAELAGRRQVLKFSYHWVIPPRKWATFIMDIGVAVGLANLKVGLPMHMPAGTRSYHLEFQTPPELDIRALSLPADPAINNATTSVDSSGIPVAHVHHSYTRVPAGDAHAQLRVPMRGLWTSAVLAALLTTTVFILALNVDGAISKLTDEGGNAAALFLAAPAVFIGFLVARTEHTFSSRVLNPLRAMLIVCALLLFAMAGSIVIGQQRLDLPSLWCAGAWISGVIAGALVSIRAITRVRYSRWFTSIPTRYGRWHLARRARKSSRKTVS
ncbi:hypothetical protein [Mycetocola tolaasinivorans]|uniref:hypothetical protein n=1 Tax=Mycetocola tolaasinivorans TaxID=76635 RepID=UPI0011C46971|nr:hypothetical protein [Mycetocola tolaasinivorans]